MTIQNIKSLIWQSLAYSTVALTMLATMATLVNAQDGRLFGGGFLKRGCGQKCDRCPECDEEYCKVSCVKVDEPRIGFKVDYKTICIPKVKLPWDNCCEPRCAETRSVKILVVHKYTCPKCKCKWEVVKPEPCVPGGEFSGHERDGQPYIEGAEYYGSPEEYQGQPTDTQGVPVEGQPLNQVPIAPPKPGNDGNTQQQYNDYFAPAKFSKQK